MNEHYYDVELRGKYTGVIYKSFQTRVYKEALKLSKTVSTLCRGN